MVKTGSGQNYYSLSITTIDPCLTSSFLEAPVISSNPLKYFPQANSTVSVPVTWALDTVGAV